MKKTLTPEEYQEVKRIIQRIIDLGDELVEIFESVEIAQLRFQHPVFSKILDELGIERIRRQKQEKDLRNSWKAARVLQAANNKDQIIE